VGASVSVYFAFLIIFSLLTPFLYFFCSAVSINSALLTLFSSGLLGLFFSGLLWLFFSGTFFSADFGLFWLGTFPDLDFPIRLYLGVGGDSAPAPVVSWVLGRIRRPR